MSIKLKGSTDGSVTLQAPADTSPTGTDKTLILPTGVGSAGQVLKNGSTPGTLEFGAAGKILQVVQTTKTDVDSMTGTTFDDLGLSVTITPSSSSSKVLIFVYASIGSLASYDMKLRLLRGTTPISIGDAAGNRARASTSLSFSWSTGSYAAGNAAINFLDSPATTSATTYKLQAASYNTSVVIAINRGPNDTDLAEYEGRTASSMIAMEVAA